MKRREVKSKGEKERIKHLNAEFQRIARRDKKDTRGRLPVSSSMAPLANFMAHCSGFTEPSPAAAAMAPAGEAAAAEGRGKNISFL